PHQKSDYGETFGGKLHFCLKNRLVSQSHQWLDSFSPLKQPKSPLCEKRAIKTQNYLLPTSTGVFILSLKKQAGLSSNAQKYPEDPARHIGFKATRPLKS